VAAAAEARAQLADVVGARARVPRVHAGRDLDARRRARAGDRVRAGREQLVAEESRVARAHVVEAIEHDHVAVPRAQALDVVHLLRALGLDGGELRRHLRARRHVGERPARQPLDVARGVDRRAAVREPRGEPLCRRRERDGVVG